MRTLCCSLVLLMLAACNSSSDTKPAVPKDTVSATVTKKDSSLTYIHKFADTLLENKITAALMKLPFVKKSDRYIDSFSNHQHGIAFMLDSLGKGEKEISVQAGYNGDERFETYYHFYVNPQTLEIKVYDVVNDRKLSVKEFIKSQQ